MRLWLALLLLVAAAQIVVPASIIVDRELTLANGRPFKLRTAPVDPVDAFRGRYVWLAFEIQDYETSTQYEHGDRLHAVLRENDEGFAEIARLSREPVDGDSALWVTVQYPAENRVRLELPFDRFYLDERDAPRAERAVREASFGDSIDASAAVRIRGNSAVLEQLYLGERTVYEYLREHSE